MFEVMTSGLHYMCVEQELAFNATIKCIDDEAGLVQSGKADTQKFPLYFCIFSECDAQCQTKNLFMNWMMRTAMADTIQQGVSGIVGAATGTNPNPLGFLQNGAAGGAPTGWADILAQRPPSAQDAQQGFENFRQFTNDLCRSDWSYSSIVYLLFCSIESAIVCLIVFVRSSIPDVKDPPALFFRKFSFARLLLVRISCQFFVPCSDLSCQSSVIIFTSKLV